MYVSHKGRDINKVQFKGKATNKLGVRVQGAELAGGRGVRGGGLVLRHSKVEGESCRRGNEMEIGRPNHGAGLRGCVL